METEQIILIPRSGFEYRYKIRQDDDILPLYDDEINCSCVYNYRCFLLDVRTNFILKASDSEEIMDSERFASIFPVDQEDERRVFRGTVYRLFEYWLPVNEILRLAKEAFRFAKRMESDPRNKSLRVIPIVVSIDVCTVQLQGESLGAAMDRSIKPDCLIPFQVWGKSIVLADRSRKNGVSQDTQAIPLRLRMYLLTLPRERVEDVADGLARMEECSICSKAPTFGAQITPLPCGHTFHNHCIVRWLWKNKTICPFCRVQIVIKAP